MSQSSSEEFRYADLVTRDTRNDLRLCRRGVRHRARIPSPSLSRDFIGHIAIFITARETVARRTLAIVTPLHFP